MRDLMWWARWLVVSAIICAVIIFIFTTATNYQSYKNSSTASEIAADDFYSFSILDSPEEKQILQDEKSSLQKMTTRKRNTMNHDMAMQGGVILGLSAAWGILIFAKRAEQGTSYARRVRKSTLYGTAEAKTEQPEELHMQ